MPSAASIQRTRSRGIAGVERHVGGARLEHAEEGHHHLQPNARGRAPPGSPGRRPRARRLAGRRGSPAARARRSVQARAAADDGDCAPGPRRGLRREQLVQQLPPRAPPQAQRCRSTRRGAGGARPRRASGSSDSAQPRVRRPPLVSIVRECRQQALQRRARRRDRSLARARVEPALRLRATASVKSKLRRAGWAWSGTAEGAGGSSTRFVAAFWSTKHDLEERVCGSVSRSGWRSSTSRSNGRSWCAEAPSEASRATASIARTADPRRPGAQDQGVDEEADQRLDLAAACGRRSACRRRSRPGRT